MPVPTFGAKGRYYAGARGEIHEQIETQGDVPEQVQRFLRDHMPDAEQRVRRAVEQWNQVVRNAIIAETGLRLSAGEEQTSVPIRILPGLPKPFVDAVTGISPELWDLVFSQQLLNATDKGLEFLTFKNSVLQVMLPVVEGGQVHIDQVRDILSQVLKFLETVDFAARFRLIDQDVLGAYLILFSEVHLYWMAIGLLARYLGASVESVAVVILTHELAHGYTHLGRDVDGSRWATQHFADTELAIVEGLAQFYTEQICQRQASRAPELLETFKALCELQASPYTRYQEWGGVDKAHQGEVVRFAMVACRTRPIQGYEQFMRTVAEAKQQVGSRQKHLL